MIRTNLPPSDRSRPIPSPSPPRKPSLSDRTPITVPADLHNLLGSGPVYASDLLQALRQLVKGKAQ